MTHRTLRIAIAAALILVAAAPPARAQKLVRHYEFKSSLKDSAQQGPDIQSVNGGLGDGVYSFLPGQGLRLEKAGVTDHYSIEITMKFEDVADWQKILDFKNLTVDTGLYVLNGMLQFYELGIGGDFAENQNHRVRLTRDRGNRAVRGYVNDQLAFEFTDAEDQAVFDNEVAVFFMDDAETMGGETAPGSVTRIRIWDSPDGK